MLMSFVFRYLSPTFLTLCAFKEGVLFAKLVLTIHEGTIRPHMPKLHIFGAVRLKESSIAVMNAETIT